MLDLVSLFLILLLGADRGVARPIATAAAAAGSLPGVAANQTDKLREAVNATGAEFLEAAAYLKKFGYLPPSFNASSAQVDGASAIAEAIAQFQSVYELPVTGQLTSATLEAMREGRCGVADDPIVAQRLGSSSLRSRRSILHRSELSSGAEQPKRFPTRSLTWYLGEVGRLDRAWVLRLLRLAFGHWAAVTPLLFRHVASPIYAGQVDIQIGFYSKKHAACRQDFDGPGGDAAHTQAAKSIHIDSEELFHLSEHGVPHSRQVHLLRLLVHEIGHLLGLRHSSDRSSIMHPSSATQQPVQFTRMRSLPLATVDEGRGLIRGAEIRMVWERYGPCSPRIDAIVDWKRRPGDSSGPTSTRIVSCSSVWTRPASRWRQPQSLGEAWRGLANLAGIDALMQAESADGKVLQTLAFAGSKYYRLDSATGQLIGEPGDFSVDFGPKAGETQLMPRSLDAAYYDTAKQRAIFIAGIWAYEYDLMHPNGTLRLRNCCERHVKLTTMFPPALVQGAGSSQQKPLPTRLDSAHYRSSDGSVLLIAGTDFWRFGAASTNETSSASDVEGGEDEFSDVGFDNSVSGGNSTAAFVDEAPDGETNTTALAAAATPVLRYGGKVYHQWRNLCSVADAQCDLNQLVKRQ